VPSARRGLLHFLFPAAFLPLHIRVEKFCESPCPAPVVVLFLRAFHLAVCGNAQRRGLRNEQSSISLAVMSENEAFLKCVCAKCGNRLSFPARARGMTINCPHCSQQTVLSAASLSATPVPVAISGAAQIKPQVRTLNTVLPAKSSTGSAKSGHRYSAHNMAKPVNFYCSAKDAHSVAVVGDFNGWNPAANPMRRQRDGNWFAEIELNHGHHHYLFLVDGQLTLDPRANGMARNERNERVSLIAVS
jgi:DNA-directed RNA polymerase subunit RPC12/RpoP